MLKKKIVRVDREQYAVLTSEFGKSKFWVFFILGQLVISELVVLVVMITYNGMLLCSLKHHYKADKSLRKRSLNSEYRSTKHELRVAVMVITMSLVALLSNSPTVFIHTIELIFYKLEATLVAKLNALSNLLVVASYTAYIFVFYHFNILFRHTLREMIASACACVRCCCRPPRHHSCMMTRLVCKLSNSSLMFEKQRKPIFLYESNV